MRGLGGLRPLNSPFEGLDDFFAGERRIFLVWANSVVMPWPKVRRSLANFFKALQSIAWVVVGFPEADEGPALSVAVASEDSALALKGFSVLDLVALEESAEEVVDGRFVDAGSIEGRVLQLPKDLLKGWS